MFLHGEALFCRRRSVVKLRRQRMPPTASGHLLDDVISNDVIADDVVTRLPAAPNDDEDGDVADDVDEQFRDAAYWSVKRRKRPPPPSPLRRLLAGPDSRTTRRVETVVYRPTRAPDSSDCPRRCAFCGDVTTTTIKWTSGSSSENVDERPDLIDVCRIPPPVVAAAAGCCQHATASTRTDFAHRCGAVATANR